MPRQVTATAAVAAQPVSDIHAQQLLVSRAKAARLCDRSIVYWRRLEREGLVPAAIDVGGSLMYSVRDLELWVALGCPSRKEFERFRRQTKGPDHAA